MDWDISLEAWRFSCRISSVRGFTFVPFYRRHSGTDGVPSPNPALPAQDWDVPEAGVIEFSFGIKKVTLSCPVCGTRKITFMFGGALWFFSSLWHSVPGTDGLALVFWRGVGIVVQAWDIFSAARPSLIFQRGGWSLQSELRLMSRTRTHTWVISLLVLKYAINRIVVQIRGIFRHGRDLLRSWWSSRGNVLVAVTQPLRPKSPQVVVEDLGEKVVLTKMQALLVVLTSAEKSEGDRVASIKVFDLLRFLGFSGVARVVHQGYLKNLVVWGGFLGHGSAFKSSI